MVNFQEIGADILSAWVNASATWHGIGKSVLEVDKELS
jgi:hypothetical protein